MARGVSGKQLSYLTLIRVHSTMHLMHPYQGHVTTTYLLYAQMSTFISIAIYIFVSTTGANPQVSQCVKHCILMHLNTPYVFLTE